MSKSNSTLHDVVAGVLKVHVVRNSYDNFWNSVFDLSKADLSYRAVIVIVITCLMKCYRYTEVRVTMTYLSM